MRTLASITLPVLVCLGILQAPTSNAQDLCPLDSIKVGLDDPGYCGCGNQFTPEEMDRIQGCLDQMATESYTLSDGTTFHGPTIANDLLDMVNEGRMGRGDGSEEVWGCTWDDNLQTTDGDLVNIADDVFDSDDPLLCSTLAHEWVHAQASSFTDCDEAQAYELGQMVYLDTSGGWFDDTYTYFGDQAQYYWGLCPTYLASFEGRRGPSTRAQEAGNLQDSNAPSGGGSIEFGSFGNVYIASQDAGQVVLSKGGIRLSAFSPLPSHLFFSSRHVALSNHDVVLAFGCDTTAASNPIGALTAFDADATHLFNRSDFVMAGVKHPTGVDRDPVTGRWYVLDAHVSGSGITVWSDTNGDAVPDTQLPAFAPSGFPGLEGGVSLALLGEGSPSPRVAVTSEDLRGHGWRDYTANVAVLRDTNGDGIADESVTTPLMELVAFAPAIVEKPAGGATQVHVRGMAGHWIEIWRSDASGATRMELLGSIVLGSTEVTTVPLTQTLVAGWYVMALDATLSVQLPAARLVVVVTGVSEENEATAPPPVYPAAPNPFGGRTMIGLSSAVKTAVEMAVYDLAGRRVRTEMLRPGSAGPRTMEWDGRDGHGVALPSGVYFTRINVDGKWYTQRVVLLR